MLDIETSNNGSVSCIKLAGDLDIATVEKFRSSIESIPDSTSEICIEFTGLKFLDSTGAGSLVQVMNQVTARDIKVKITKIPRKVFEVLDVLGIPELMGEENFEHLE